MSRMGRIVKCHYDGLKYRYRMKSEQFTGKLWFKEFESPLSAQQSSEDSEPKFLWFSHHPLLSPKYNTSSGSMSPRHKRIHKNTADWNAKYYLYRRQDMSLEMIHFQKCKKWGNSKEERRTNDFTLQSACLDDSTVGAYHGHGRGLAESIIVSMMSVPASWTNGRAYHGHGHRLHHRLQHDVRVGELKGARAGELLMCGQFEQFFFFFVLSSCWH